MAAVLLFTQPLADWRLEREQLEQFSIKELDAKPVGDEATLDMKMEIDSMASTPYQP